MHLGNPWPAALHGDGFFTWLHTREAINPSMRLSVQEVKPRELLIFPFAYYEFMIRFWLVWYVICTDFAIMFPLYSMILMLLITDARIYLSSLHDHYMMCIICGGCIFGCVLFVVFLQRYKTISCIVFSTYYSAENCIIDAWIYMQANGAEDKKY